MIQKVTFEIAIADSTVSLVSKGNVLIIATEPPKLPISPIPPVERSKLSSVNVGVCDITGSCNNILYRCFNVNKMNK